MHTCSHMQDTHTHTHTHTTCTYVCLHARTLMHAKLHVQTDICILVDYIAMQRVHVDVQAGHTLAFLYQCGFYNYAVDFLFRLGLLFAYVA